MINKELSTKIISSSMVDKLMQCGAMTCKFWLTKNLWPKELPVLDPVQRGEEVTHFFLSPGVSEQTKQAFIKGWDAYLDDPAFLG